MRSPLPRALLLCWMVASTSLGQPTTPVQAGTAADSLVQHFVSDFDLPTARQEAEARLQRNPNDVIALFVRMEAAELQERPEIVLDSAVRLCALPAGLALHEVASNRVLQHAGNTRAFNSAARRTRAAATLANDCAFNLRLALVAAAMDGEPKIDLDHAVRSAGLVTRWRIVGPFGQYSNLDFERSWPAEFDQATRQQYSSDAGPIAASDGGKKNPTAGARTARTVKTEQFWFRDGMLSLPDYLSGAGIYYAAGDVEISKGGPAQIEVLSSGTYAVLVDGREAMLHDARYAAGASRNVAALRLSPGRHHVLVKFTADATPLSVAIHPQSQLEDTKLNLPRALESYAAALVAYFRGDHTAMQRMLHSVDPPSGVAPYLRALLYSGAEDRSPRADAAWKAVASAQPSAFLARLKSAENAMARGRSDDSRQDVMAILAERPQSETTLRLAFNLSRGHTDAPGLLDRLLQLHPSCANLAQAVKFYSSIAEQDKAGQLEQQLSVCAPESLQYARTLAESGRHGAAAAFLQQFIGRNPFHRTARRLLVEQLVLSSQQSAARLQARQLSDLAPNARIYAGLAEAPDSVQDSRSRRAAAFTEGREFYVPYQRDGLELVSLSARRNFSGGSAVILLSDKVVEVQPDGAVSVYVHRITRPLNKDGIGRYGEVSLPRGADLLELRTIKAAGRVIEPELTQQKATISMPALEAGDAIEEEYVIHYAEAAQSPESACALTFGSFDAPILYSRFVLLTPVDAKLNVHEQAGAPQPLVGENRGTLIRIWERENIAQTVAESFLPSAELLPRVSVEVAEKTRERLRDELFDATRTGLHVNEAGLELNLTAAVNENEKARRLYRFVTSRIDSTGPDWAANPAEDTLQNGQGSRTSALLALARITGLKAGLLLARKVDQSCARHNDLSCYSEPLVRFWFAGGEWVDVDAEADDLPYGSLPPALEPREALLVLLPPDNEKRPETTVLAVRHALERSTADGEISFQQGDLVVDLHVRLGVARAQEVRSLLHQAGERESQTFFEQLAMRIFPEAASVTGSAAHAADPELPLELSLHCIVPQFLNQQSGVVEIDQLVPALGLRAQYARTPARKFPLYVESLFFESTTFHLHLPAGMRVRSVPADFIGRSEFGEYSLRFTNSAQQLDIHREFHIPVQVIAPEKYAAFAHFARQIEEAERQRVSLDVGKDASAGNQYRVPPAAGMLR